jgi:hypothetical protein
MITGNTKSGVKTTQGKIYEKKRKRVHTDRSEVFAGHRIGVSTLLKMSMDII